MRAFMRAQNDKYLMLANPNTPIFIQASIAVY